MNSVDIDSFLNLDLDEVEPANIGRGGWSGVCRLETASRPLYLKRQKNHVFRDPRMLFRKMPTLRREYRNIHRLQSIGIPTVRVLLFSMRKLDACMLVEAVNGQPLDEVLRDDLDPGRRSLLIGKLARLLFSLHQHHLVHGCLYAKHIFVNEADPENPISLIDLEKMRPVIRRRRAATRDLSQFFRHSAALTDTDRETIIAVYESHWPGFRKVLERRLFANQFLAPPGTPGAVQT